MYRGSNLKGIAPVKGIAPYKIYDLRLTILDFRFNRERILFTRDSALNFEPRTLTSRRYSSSFLYNSFIIISIATDTITAPMIIIIFAFGINRGSTLPTQI